MKSEYKDHLYALILAGGGGTRLWPKSRNDTPKQFLKLFNDQTLTQITAYRFNKILEWEKIFCVTVSDAYKKEILKEVPEFLPQNIFVEPARRETGPAHGLAAMMIYKKDPNAVIITESADRLVNPVSIYLRTLKRAAKLAYEKNILITVGVVPTYPNIGYGYIKRGSKVFDVRKTEFFKVDEFKEKPELETAKRYVKSGNYYWNAGQFVWKAEDFLEALREHQPDVYKQLEGINSENLKSRYENMPKISVDYAVAEKSNNMYVVEADFFWTDIGDWKEVWTNLKKDEMGNVVIDGGEGGEVVNIDTSDSLIHTNGRMVAIIDVDNIIVVDTKEALLICSKSRAQNVKQIVEQLKTLKKDEYL